MKWITSITLGAVLALLGATSAYAGSIGLMPAGGEDGMLNAYCTALNTPTTCCTGNGTGICGSNVAGTCTGNGTPAACCTGANTGTCGGFDGNCTAAGVPFTCCTAPGAGTCAPVTQTAPRNIYYGLRSRPILADFAQNAATRCIWWHFPMPPDYVAQSQISWVANLMGKGTGGGAILFSVSMSCTTTVGGAENYLTDAISGGGEQTAFGATANTIQQIALTATIPMTASCHPKDSVSVRFCRTGGDTGNPDLSLIDLTLQY